MLLLSSICCVPETNVTLVFFAISTEKKVSVNTYSPQGILGTCILFQKDLRTMNLDLSMVLVQIRTNNLPVKESRALTQGPWPLLEFPIILFYLLHIWPQEYLIDLRITILIWFANRKYKIVWLRDLIFLLVILDVFDGKRLRSKADL